MLGGPPSKIVVFQLGIKSGRLSSAGCELNGVSDAGQSFPCSYRLYGTDYGTSELESFAWRWADELSDTGVYAAGVVNFVLFPEMRRNKV